ncbi:MAG: hypothetical protein QW379_00635 [Thermoplasmata archaeon]
MTDRGVAGEDAVGSKEGVWERLGAEESGEGPRGPPRISEERLAGLVFLLSLLVSFVCLLILTTVHYGPPGPVGIAALLVVSALIGFMGRSSFIRRRAMVRRRLGLERILEMRRAERERGLGRRKDGRLAESEGERRGPRGGREGGRGEGRE